MPKPVNYHKENRSKSYHNMLTTDDRDMPSNYYTMWELAKALGIPSYKIRDYRRDSYEALKNICEAEKIKKFDKYWNDNAHKFDSTVNFFLKEEALRPVAHLIRLKIVTRLSTRSEFEQLPQKYASFGIFKNYWNNYVINGKIAHPERKMQPRKNDLKNAGRTCIDVEGHSLFVPMDDIYLKFKNGSKAQGLTLSTATIIAFKEYMNNHSEYFEEPESIPDPYKEYNKGTGIVYGKINENVANEMRKIVKNYNLVNDKKILICQYMESAINDKNKSVPLKYRDPEKYMLALEQEKWLKENNQKQGEKNGKTRKT